jgi:choline monooxygenase
MPLLAVRGADGVLRVFHNICPYDGCLALLREARGLKHIEVYYHGWRYDLAGRLVAAPYWSGAPEGRPETLGSRGADLIEVRSAVRLGTLFVDMDGQAGDIDAWLRPLLDLIGRDFAHAALVPAVDPDGRALIEERTVRANWKTYQENASINVLHEAFTHELYRKSPEVPRIEGGRTKFTVHLDGCLVAFSYADEDTANTYEKLPLPHAGPAPDRPPGRGYFATLYPNINVPCHSVFVKVNICIPVGPAESRIHHLFLFRPEAVARPDFGAIEHRLRTSFHQVYGEDRVAIEAVQKARASPVARQHYYAPLWDAQHHRFNQLVLADLERA